MPAILRKELTLSASILAYLFILFALMFFIPGYPILCGAFFVTLGIFQSFQAAREANDLVFSVLLPIAKRDVVRGRYLFVCLIEGAAGVLMALIVLLRMTLLSQSPVYRSNALMNANLFALGAAFVIFALFNLIFVGGFFRTGHQLGRPFVIYIIVVFPVILAAESLHHIPGWEVLNAFGTDALALQLGLFVLGLAVYLSVSILACRKACRRFEKMDL